MKLSQRVSLLILIAALYGCDIYEKDSKPVAKFDHTISTTQGSPTLINSRAYFNDQCCGQFHVVKQPAHGTVSIVADGQYFYYKPDSDSAKEDQFVAELVSASGERLALSTLRVSSVEPCGKGPVVTYVKISNKNPYILNLLDNDVFCNTNFEDAAIFARKSINAVGQGIYRLDMTSATFSYTPELGFTGVSEFYYDLGINPNPRISDWDDFMKNNWFYHPEKFEKYVSVKLVVEVTP